ncbi:hypothetical protein [Kitasatospora sp. NPDC088264]|uniref:hypothetical protein n=1 Tax=unclassified Kitasatospora TaxID=2633591 RepID=UPI003437252A
MATRREQAGPDGLGLAWERRWRSFPRLLVVLAGVAAAGVRGAVADLWLTAEENPATAELLTAEPPQRARSRWEPQQGLLRSGQGRSARRGCAERAW